MHSLHLNFYYTLFKCIIGSKISIIYIITVHLIISSLICFSCLILFFLSFSMLSVNERNSKPSVAVSEPPKSPPPIEVPAMPLDELVEKTDNFGSKSLIGEGSYGRVYFAVLNDERQVAIKKLDVSSEPNSSNEFLSQVCLILFILNIFNTYFFHYAYHFQLQNNFFLLLSISLMFILSYFNFKIVL